MTVIAYKCSKTIPLKINTLLSKYNYYLFFVYLFTLEFALPVGCPLQKDFHFTYSNRSGCYCRSPISYVHHCASLSTLHFAFKHCRQCARSQGLGNQYASMSEQTTIKKNICVISLYQWCF